MLQALWAEIQQDAATVTRDAKVVEKLCFMCGIKRTTGLEPSFGVYVDGVFQGRPIAYNIDLVDIERVEHLRGPQASLYGKNTISGAINIVTQ